MTPFGTTVAGAGMVEPNTEASGTATIALGSQSAGLVMQVHARIGQPVKLGDLLFALDKRQAEADLGVRLAAVAAAEAQLRQLELQPRAELVPVTEAQVAAAEADLRQKQDLRDRNARLAPTGAIAEEDMVAAEQNFQVSRAEPPP